MVHERRDIKDRVATGDDCFYLQELPDGRIKLVPAPDSILEVGTDINKALLQPIEDDLISVANDLELTQADLDQLIYDVEDHTGTRASQTYMAHVNHFVLTTTLDTTWTGTSAPYTKTITVSGILSTDTPVVDIVMSGTFATDEARIENWAYIYRVVSADNSLTFYATDKPIIDLPIQIKVVR